MTPDNLRYIAVLVVALCFCISLWRIRSGLNRHLAWGGSVGCGLILTGVVSGAIFEKTLLMIVLNVIGALIICTTFLLTAKARFS